MKTNLIITGIAAVLALVCGYTALAVRDNYITRDNTLVLRDIVFNTLARTERSIDQSITRIGDVYGAGGIACGEGASRKIDDIVFKSSKIKELAFFVDGQSCASNNERSLLNDVFATGETGLAARNNNIKFKVAQVDDLTGLVLKWQLSENQAVAAFLNTTELVFDVLPVAIRDVANLEISMSDGTMLGFLQKGMTARPNDVRIELASERYPLSVKLSMSKAAMDAWRNEVPFLTKLFGGLALFGIFFLMTRGFFSPATSAQSIRRALKKGLIFPYYQPVYSLRSGELLGFEVLARRKSKDGQLMSPATFIPLIEKHDLGDALLEVLIRDAAKNMQAVFDEPQMVTFAFNVTPKQISRDGFVTWFVDLLADTGIASDRIILEVTEREVISDLPNLQKNISALRDYDITIAIDDVGTGHNGLSSIHQLRADYLKIDKLFVDGIVMDEHASALVKMLIDIGAQYGMQIIAEGVEDEQQLEALNRLGVDEAQGFYMAKPMPASDAIIELAHHRAVRTKLILADDLKVPAKKAINVAKTA